MLPNPKKILRRFFAKNAKSSPNYPSNKSGLVALPPQKPASEQTNPLFKDSAYQESLSKYALNIFKTQLDGFPDYIDELIETPAEAFRLFNAIYYADQTFFENNILTHPKASNFFVAGYGHQVALKMTDRIWHQNRIEDLSDTGFTTAFSHDGALFRYTMTPLPHDFLRDHFDKITKRFHALNRSNKLKILSANCAYSTLASDQMMYRQHDETSDLLFEFLEQCSPEEKTQILSADWTVSELCPLAYEDDFYVLFEALTQKQQARVLSAENAISALCFRDTSGKVRQMIDAFTSKEKETILNTASVFHALLVYDEDYAFNLFEDITEPKIKTRILMAAFEHIQMDTEGLSASVRARCATIYDDLKKGGWITEDDNINIVPFAHEQEDTGLGVKLEQAPDTYSFAVRRTPPPDAHP